MLSITTWTAQSPRLTAAQALIAQADARGAAAFDERLEMHTQLLQLYDADPFFDTETHRDPTRLRQEAERILTIGRTDHVIAAEHRWKTKKVAFQCADGLWRSLHLGLHTSDCTTGEATP